MGIGGGFIIVPAMIYLLRMPTNVVIGTSLVQIIGVAVITTLLQATSNYAVDIVLAAILVVGGVIGAQFGVRAGAKLRGEQLRLLLALLVLAVARTVAVGPGGDARRISTAWRGYDAARALLLALLLIAAPAGATRTGLRRQPGPDPDHLQLYRQRHCRVRRRRRPGQNAQPRAQGCGGGGARPRRRHHGAPPRPGGGHLDQSRRRRPVGHAVLLFPGQHAAADGHRPAGRAGALRHRPAEPASPTRSTAITTTNLSARRRCAI